MLIILIIFLNGLMIKKIFLEKIKFIQFAVNVNNIDYFLEWPKYKKIFSKNKIYSICR